MQVFVNDECLRLDQGNIPHLLHSIGAQSDRVVVVVNGQVIPQEQRQTIVLNEQDRVDVFTFAGGG